MATPATRQRPNVLLTGTPGVGKSTLASKVAENLGFTYIDAAHEIKANELYSEYDEERKCHVLNEDAFLDHLQDRFDSNEGGLVIDYHACELFPERWFDFVFVVRCDNTVLYDRLTARGYDQKKVQENVECEIFGTIVEEARDAYKDEVVHELTNESEEQLAKNVNLITQTKFSFMMRSSLAVFFIACINACYAAECPTSSVFSIYLYLLLIIPTLINAVAIGITIFTIVYIKRLRHVTESVKSSTHWLTRMAVNIGIGPTAKRALRDYAERKPELRHLMQDPAPE